MIARRAFLGAPSAALASYPVGESSRACPTSLVSRTIELFRYRVSTRPGSMDTHSSNSAEWVSGKWITARHASVHLAYRRMLGDDGTHCGNKRLGGNRDERKNAVQRWEGFVRWTQCLASNC